MNLANEAFIYWTRSPTPGLRFVRVSRWPSTEFVPHSKSLGGREVLGWTLDSSGRCVRLFSVRTDVPYDGCRDWTPCAQYPDSPVDPESIRIKQPGNPPREQFSTAGVEEVETAHRRPFADYWAVAAANAAAVAKAQAEQEAKADREAAERVQPKPRSWLARLLGR